MRSCFIALVLVVSCVVVAGSQDASPSYRIAVLQDDVPGADPVLSAELVDRLSGRHAVDGIDYAGLCEPDAILADAYDLLILPNSSSLPAAVVPTVTRFLAAGGDLLALRAPAFAELLWKSGETWLSEARWRALLEEQSAAAMLIDFESEDPTAFQRSTNTPDSPAAWELSDGPWGRALEVTVENLQGWDTLSLPVAGRPFPRGHRLTCLRARGSAETRMLSLEWRENDGSRWIATFPVSEEWRHVVLAPQDFRFWESVPGRGHPGDAFRPEAAAGLTVGVAWTHTEPKGGRHAYAVDEIGTALNPVGVPPPELQSPAPRVEGLSPGYKFYELGDVDRLASSAPWVSADRREPLPMPDRLRAHHPRPTGKGIGKERGWRWIPILEALGPDEEWRGAPASLYIDFAGPTRGSVRASLAVDDAAWYRDPDVLRLLEETVDRLSRQVFLEEAGAEFFTYRPGEPVRIGARVANLAGIDVPGLRLESQVESRDGSWSVARPQELPPIGAGETHSVDHRIRLPDESSDFVVEVCLFQDDILIDRIRHEIGVYRAKPESARDYVTAHDGDFYLQGAKWYVHGVNYMPSTGIAIEDQANFEHWIDAPAYDPEFVQRDLERCRAIGLNSVSMFIYHQSVQANNLLDFLRRAENLGLRVNLSIRPGTPMDYRWEWWEEIIRHSRLWELDVIYAYDIAWEPFFGTLEVRRRYDPDWQQWLEDKYGSIREAEAAWGVPALLHDGRITGPGAAELGRDGPHRRMVADYRHFVDALIHARYQEAADRIRAMDPHHLVSFRMTVTGDPTFDGSNNMPYDFAGVARSMDFMAPEGYGRIGDWDRVKPGIFTVAYARYAAPGKPVLWAEAGVHAWNNREMRTDPDLLAFQARFYADYYRMVLASHSNGIVWWWYPGGYRTNEQSDYGILNPDGTDRPVTDVIRRFGPDVLSTRDIPQPDVWIDIDRDADSRGLPGIYDQVKDQFWRAIDAGQFPELR